MNRNEAKDILLLYRHHNPADEKDPLIMEALALAKQDPELAGWLEMHCARQFVLHEKFQQISVPEGLKEQIISEQAASHRAAPRGRQLVLAASLVMVMVLSLASVWLNNRQRPDENTLAVYQGRMARIALSGYAMDLVSEDSGKIHDYLKAKNAPVDYAVSASLSQAGLSGCAVETWQDKKVSLVCFRTGRPLAAGERNDLWLFVVDQDSVKDAPVDSSPRIATVNNLLTATWVRDGKLYFLGMEGEPAELKKYL